MPRSFPVSYSASIEIPSQRRWVVSFGGPDLDDVCRRAWEYGVHYAEECGYDVACTVEANCSSCWGQGFVVGKRGKSIRCPACKGAHCPNFSI